MTQQEKDDLQCDILLFIAIPTEEKKLRQVAGQLRLQFERRTVADLGDYFLMGTIGRTRVNAALQKWGLSATVGPHPERSTFASQPALRESSNWGWPSESTRTRNRMVTF
jgi:hypothetical protein